MICGLEAEAWSPLWDMVIPTYTSNKYIKDVGIAEWQKVTKQGRDAV